MLAPILDRMMHFNLGGLGRWMLQAIQENLLIFLVLFTVYGLLLFYAKMVWTEYLPKKMKVFLQEQYTENQQLTKEELFDYWLIQRKKLPKYLLVPTRNELWVKPASRISGNEQMLFFNSEIKKMSEKERFMRLAEEQMV